MAAIEQDWAHVLVQRSGSAKQGGGANSHAARSGSKGEDPKSGAMGELWELYIEAGESRQYRGDPNQRSWGRRASDKDDLVHCAIPMLLQLSVLDTFSTRVYGAGHAGCHPEADTDHIGEIQRWEKL